MIHYNNDNNAYCSAVNAQNLETSELPLRGSFSKRSTARRVNGSLSLSTILYMCQPHSTQLQKATLLLLHLIRLKGTFCCIDGWWVYVGGSRN